MNKVFFIFIVMVALSMPSFAFWHKKEKPVLLLSDNNPEISLSYDEKLKDMNIFKKQTRIYFLVYNPSGFKSDYIKYQIIKQDDKAHIGGFSRIMNRTCRVKNKNYYSDYFLLTEAGKYAIQIFDIENLHHWITYGYFRVVED